MSIKWLSNLSRIAILAIAAILISCIASDAADMKTLGPVATVNPSLITGSTPQPASGTNVELFGHVTLVRGYAVPSFTGCHALVELRDQPGTTVAVMTPEVRLQSLLETALQTGYLISFTGQKYSNPPTPLGGTWSVDVYNINGVILYNSK